MSRQLLGDDLDAVVAGYLNGQTFAALGREYGCTPLKVKRALLGAGVTLRTPKRSGGAKVAKIKNQPAQSASEGEDEPAQPAQPTQPTQRRESENFVVTEPPRPKAAKVDRLDKKRDKARAVKAKPRKGKGKADLITEDEAELEEGLAAYDAGVDDEGHVDRILALAAKLRRAGKMSLRQYTRLVDSILDESESSDEPVRYQVPTQPRGANRRTGGRPEPRHPRLQGAGGAEGRPELQGVAEPPVARLRAGGPDQRAPVAPPAPVNALAAILAGYNR